MKNFYRTKSLVLAVSAAFAFCAVTVRADDEKKPARRHHVTKEKTYKTRKLTAQEKKEAGTNRRTMVLPGRSTAPTIDDRNSLETKGQQVGGANGPEYRVPTGSNIPRHYNRRGYTTDDDRNSFIYDQNDQRLRSTNSVGESLRTVPGVTVRGRGL